MRHIKDRKRLIKDFILIALGILSAGLGLKGFLIPNDFIDGGVTGISLLTSEVTGFTGASSHRLNQCSIHYHRLQAGYQNFCN